MSKMSWEAVTWGLDKDGCTLYGCCRKFQSPENIFHLVTLGDLVYLAMGVVPTRAMNASGMVTLD
jgi:hypothetical protein